MMLILIILGPQGPKKMMMMMMRKCKRRPPYRSGPGEVAASQPLSFTQAPHGAAYFFVS